MRTIKDTKLSSRKTALASIVVALGRSRALLMGRLRALQLRFDGVRSSNEQNRQAADSRLFKTPTRRQLFYGSKSTSDQIQRERIYATFS